MGGTQKCVGHHLEFMCVSLVQNISNQFVGFFDIIVEISKSRETECEVRQ